MKFDEINQAPKNINKSPLLGGSDELVIIGGSGFIGTRLCDRFRKEGSSFLIIDKISSDVYPETTVLADVRELNKLRQAIPSNSIIINLAAEHKDDVSPKSLYQEVNVGGAENICRLAREKEVNKIIFTSSVAVYGFALSGIDESGKLNPYNEYGRTKMAAERIFMEWQSEDPKKRTLIIVRPAVVFGERNRGNVYNLLKLIASSRFVMIGDGLNVKSMAYVENVAAFLQYTLDFRPGVHIYNYVDKPDFNMNLLVDTAREMIGLKRSPLFKIPYWMGFAFGKLFDVLAFLNGKSFAVSSIRVKKFCISSMYNSSIESTGFIAPVGINEGIRRTISYEFLEEHHNVGFYTE